MTQPRPLLAAFAVAAAAAALAGCGKKVDDAALLASAQAHHAKHELPAAIIEAKSVLQRDANNAQARLLLGTALLESGDAQAAAVELRKALELGAPEDKAVPRLAQALLARGEAQSLLLQFASTRLADPSAQASLLTSVAAALAQTKDRRAALDAVEQALAASPQHVPAQLLKAKLMAAGGDAKGALALVDSVIAREPADAAALMLGGDLQGFVNADAEAALARYRKAAEAQPKSVAAHAAVIDLLLRRADVDGAKAQYERLKAAQPNHPETKLYEARFALLARDYARTRELVQQLLKPYPNDVRVLQLAGVAEMRLNSLGPAENYLSQAVKAAPKAVEPRRLIAELHLRMREPKKALDALAPLLDANPDARTLTLAGQAWLQAGNNARAEQAFARAVKLDPKATAARAALALDKLAKGQTGAGLSELEAVASADAGIGADLALVSARLRAKDEAGALRAIDAIEKKQPGPLAHALRGNLLARRNDAAGAAASFAKALALDPHYLPAAAGLAQLDIAAGKPDAARKRFADVVQADPKNVRALIGLAQVKARTGAPPSEVREQLAEAVKASPNAPLPRLVLIDYLLSQGEMKAALATAQEAAAALPNDTQLLDRFGAAQVAAGEPLQAVVTYGKLVAVQPDRADPQLRLAQAQMAAGDLAGAERSLARASELAPGDINLQLGLARLAVAQKRYPAALDIARALQTQRPKEPVGFLIEADVETQRGQSDAAIAALKRAAPLASPEVAMRLHAVLAGANRKAEADALAAGWTKDHPRDAAFRQYLGDAALARGDFAGAEAHYRGVIELQPDNPLALNNVAWLMTRQGKPGAVALAERANKLMPEKAPLMDTLALALIAENQAQRALDVQKKAVAAHPGDPTLKLTLAKVYLKLGEKKEAKAELEALARLGNKLPTQGEVAELLKTL